MAMFENSRTEYGNVEYSRIIASWRNVGGIIYGYGPIDKFGFIKWLLEECHCTEPEAHDIYLMALDGKLEYEESVKKFLADDENVKAVNDIKRKVRKESMLKNKR